MDDYLQKISKEAATPGEAITKALSTLPEQRKMLQDSNQTPENWTFETFSKFVNEAHDRAKFSVLMNELKMFTRN